MYAFAPRLAAQKRRVAPTARRAASKPSARKELISILTALGAGALAAGSFAGVVAAVGYGASLTQDAYNAVVDWLYDERSAIEQRLNEIEMRLQEIWSVDPEGIDPAFQQEEATLEAEETELLNRLDQLDQAEYEAQAAATAA